MAHPGCVRRRRRVRDALSGSRARPHRRGLPGPGHLRHHPGLPLGGPARRVARSGGVGGSGDHDRGGRTDIDRPAGPPGRIVHAVRWVALGDRVDPTVRGRNLCAGVVGQGGRVPSLDVVRARDVVDRRPRRCVPRLGAVEPARRGPASSASPSALRLAALGRGGRAAGNDGVRAGRRGRPGIDRDGRVGHLPVHPGVGRRRAPPRAPGAQSVRGRSRSSSPG